MYVTAKISDKLIPPYRLTRRALGEGWKVKILPQFVECVAFLCERSKSGKLKPGGTAFFVDLPDETDRSHRWTYLVTALHCLEEIDGREVGVRINTPPNISGLRFKDERTYKDDWFKHWKADVAALLVSFDPAIYSLQRIPVEIFIRANYTLDLDAFEQHGNKLLAQSLKTMYPNGIAVKVGNELFFPGLFVQSAGTNRIHPIVRYGAISRMPSDELVTLVAPRTRETKDIRAYLA